MDADILRLILFLVGAALVFGIYAFDRYKRSKQIEPTPEWMEDTQDDPVTEHIEPTWDSLYEPTSELEEAEPQEIEIELPSEESTEEVISEKVEEQITNELDQLEEILHEGNIHDLVEEEATPEVTPKEQISISFLTGDVKNEPEQEVDVSLPTKIIQLNIVPHDPNEAFYGDDILCVVSEVGLELSELQIFDHYGDNPNGQQAIFSMASMVEPGVFPIDDMDNFSTPGLTIFARLPGPKDGLSTFTDMLHTAERLANLLDGELRDETHSALSKQTISHIREEIQEHHRQLQLARSKR